MSALSVEANHRYFGDHAVFQKPMPLVDTAYNLYGFLPATDDVRWPFLERYEQIKREVGFKAINFENAWGATYLSSTASSRRRFVSILCEDNCLQLDRALDNLEHKPEVRRRFEASADDDDGIDMELRLTDRLVSDPAKVRRIVTPCPEALYQIRLSDGQYLARVGFNLHREEDSSILSIVNIQGVPDGAQRNADFGNKFGISPFNTLVRRTLALANIDEPAFEVRGLANPKRGNSRLYGTVLSKEGVKMYHARRKPSKVESLVGCYA